MKWFLIYWLITWYGAGGTKPATAVVEFQDEAACKAALTAFKAVPTDDAWTPYGICVADRSVP